MEPVQSAPADLTHSTKLIKNFDENSSSILPPLKSHFKETQDYLPESLFKTLTQAGKKFQDLGPNATSRNKYSKKRADNLWNHENTRVKFRHLTEQPPCYCGAGRDISYLLDAKSGKNKPTDLNDNQNENVETIETVDYGKAMIPESIIPSEFVIKKHKGAVGLEILDDKYTTLTDEHGDHSTIFPSMKPSGRQEALQLLQTMKTLLKKAGIEDKKDEGKVKEGTQIEELLNLVKEEQKIYNIIFNEVIRQVSVECIERGTVLSELRKRYAKLLDRVPRQVKSLHEEVLAQRALDRRLTEELSRFKTSITMLTKELHEIHAHDDEVTRQAIETQAELNEALKESEKNASLLAEYHDLYELQRRRLDYQLSKLMEERDLWAGSAHMLSLKVTERHNLVTVRRLHLHEKSWHKLANRFTILLGQEDAKELQILAACVHLWQETSISFDERLSDFELETYRKMKSLQTLLQHWGKKFERVVTPDEGTVHVPSQEDLQNLFDVLKSWENIFNNELERFAGDVLLACEDDMLQLTKCVDNWVESAVKIFNHHPAQDDSAHPQKSTMLEMNEQVYQLHTQFKFRMSGENGLAKSYLYFINTLDTWVNKINILIHGGETMFDSEWVQLSDFLQVQWPECLQKILLILSPEEERDAVEVSPLQSIKSGDVGGMLNVEEINKVVQKWLQGIINTFENENTNMIEQVSSTHSNMIRWMITILIRMAPDNKKTDLPTSHVEEDKIAGLGSAILSETTSEAIIDRGTMLFNWLRSLTDLIVNCCKDLNTSDGEDDEEKRVEKHNKNIKSIEIECRGWMNTANLVINELTGEMIPLNDFISNGEIEQQKEGKTTIGQPIIVSVTQTADNRTDSRLEPRENGQKSDNDDSPVEVTKLKENDQEQQSVQEDNPINSPVLDDVSSEKQTEMLIIGNDDNVKKKAMKELVEESLGSSSSSSVTDVVNSSLSLEALTTLEQLQQQLLQTEKRAQSAEERAYNAESALKEAQERIRALEKSVAKMDTKGGPD